MFDKIITSISNLLLKAGTTILNKGIVFSMEDYKIAINKKIANADITIEGKNIKITVQKEQKIPLVEIKTELK